MNTDNKVQHTQGTWILDTTHRFFQNRWRVNISEKENDLTTILVIEDYTENNEEAEANAALICKAVNNHYALLEALKDAHRILLTNNSIDWWQKHKEDVASIYDTIKAAEQA